MRACERPKGSHRTVDPGRYAERVLRVFNMWDCNPVATPMDPHVRLSKLDCPEVVDPLLHRKRKPKQVVRLGGQRFCL
jgi:hypothetical protein